MIEPRRYLFEVPGRKEYLVEKPLETIKRRFKLVMNGVIDISLETAITIIQTDLGGTAGENDFVLVGEGLHHRPAVYHIPVSYEVNGKPMNSIIDVYEVIEGVGENK
jgi:hypothetical protein